MSSRAPEPANLAKAIQSFDAEHYTGPVVLYPGAPRVILPELPPNEDTIEISNGIGQWLPQHLLFTNQIARRIDYRLALRNGPRAVVQPFFGCLPTDPENPLWGAVGIPVLIQGDKTTSIDFEREFGPATEPPVIQMLITTDTEDLITVDAEQESPHVTVVDVQKAVINWMISSRTMAGVDDVTERFSRWVRMVDDNGTEVELEIWVWMGLRSLSTDMVRWHLHLCEAEIKLCAIK